MSFEAEAQIVRELGQIFKRGKSYIEDLNRCLWSTVEKTALADAEVEYQDHKSRYYICCIFKLKIQKFEGY